MLNLAKATGKNTLRKNALHNHDKSKKEIGPKAENLIKLDRKGLCPNFLVLDNSIFLSHSKIYNKTNQSDEGVVKEIYKKKLDSNILFEIKKRLRQLSIKNPIEVIVAEETSPNLAVAMSICKGIITEVGGLTSHAAIVSRELNKPCIVGVTGCLSLIK